MRTPLQEFQEKTTSTEFLEWVQFFEMEANFFHREDFYWAQIAAEIRKSYVDSKYANKVKTDDMLIKFKRVVKEAPRTAVDAARSMKNWYAALGVKKEDRDGV